jgi:hypothetical protein
MNHFQTDTLLTVNLSGNQLVLNTHDTLNVEIYWTSVGYQPTAMVVTLKNTSGRTVKYEGIWGFDVVEVEGQMFLIISEYDDRCRYMGIVDMKVSAISLKTLQVAKQEFIKADIQLN